MKSTGKLIKKELSRIEKKSNDELSEKINNDYESLKVHFEDILDEKTKIFNAEIDKKINRINKKKSTMKKVIILILFIICCWVLYTTFLKNNDNIKKIEYSLTTTKISDILNDPRTYQNETVSVSGKVVNSFNLGLKYYLLNDGTGEIYVIPKNAVPKENEIVKATGIFKQKLKIGTKQISVIEEK